jgi:hypothetical protein
MWVGPTHMGARVPAQPLTPLPTPASARSYCHPSEMAAIAYSLAYLGAAPSGDQMALLAREISRKWDRWSGDELANVAMSLALWQYKPTDRCGLRCPGCCA